MHRWFLTTALVALLIGGPWGYSHYRYTHFRNLRVVHDGVLYRSGQLSLKGLKLVLRDYQINTIVSLRDSNDPSTRPPDWREEEYCKHEGIQFVRISPREWSAADGSVPADIGVQKFLSVMDDKANYPVLVHCFRGVHRTGAFTAVYRMEYDHWSNDDAIAEMRRLGYKDLEDEWDLREFLETYKPRWQKK